MAQRADRVGVRADQVDVHGRVTSHSFLNDLIESLPEWTDMPVWVNGTEEILPSNSSVPVTSPILADIQYPDVRRNDQYFTYRESPTTVDGLAKLKRIKGNTLVFNQLIENGNFASTSNWFTLNASFSVSNNEATITATAQWGRITSANFEMVNAHKYLILSTIKGTTDNYIDTGIGNKYLTTNNQWETVSFIVESTSTSNRAISIGDKRSSGWTPFYAKNTMCFDLTQMFGAGNEPTLEQFRALFPLPYYSYQSTLLPFKGTSIKTVGKNLLTYSVSSLTTNGITFTPQNDGSVKVSGTATANAYYNIYNWANNTLFPLNKSLRLSGGTSQVRFTVAYRNTDGSGVVEAHDTGNGATITIPSADKVIYSALRVLQGTTIDTVIYPMVTFADADQTFEPYTSSTTNLPTLTYFPNGMKSAGNVYDELLPNKAITRVGMVDLGSLNWTYQSANQFFYVRIEDKKANSTNMLCSLYNNVGFKSDGEMATVNNMSIATNTLGDIKVKNTSYTSASDFKSAMNGVYLYYELATPIELPTMSFE